MPMIRRHRASVALVTMIGLSASAASPLEAGEPAAASGAAATDFSLIALPDTQYYCGGSGIFALQTSWIGGLKDVLDVRFVLHEGDMVNIPIRETEWHQASEAMGVLDGSVPYILAVGNHDMGDGSGHNAATRDKPYYHAFFPATRFECEPWYGGRMGAAENDNYYTLFEVGDLRFLIISLEFGPDDEMLDWAGTVVSNHFDRRTIVLTHCYMYHDDSRVGLGDALNPHSYGIDDLGTNDGEEMWEKFVRRHPNIFLVVSGHIHGYGSGYEAGRLSSAGDHGNTVHQLLANYQNAYYHYGDGWLRILSFLPSESRISVATYSPLLDSWLTDDENSFDLYYDMSVPACGDEHLIRPQDQESSRYLTIAPDSNRVMALQVTLKGSSFPVAKGRGWWVGPPDADGRARLQDEPVCRDWGSETVRVIGPEVLGDSDYTVRAVPCDCPFGRAAEVAVRTCRWGDVDCNERVDILDVVQTVDAVKFSEDATQYDQLPDGVVDVLDVSATVDAVKGMPWPSAVPLPTCGD